MKWWGEGYFAGGVRLVVLDRLLIFNVAAIDQGYLPSKKRSSQFQLVIACAACGVDFRLVS